MAAMSSEGKSLGNLQCLKLHLSPNLHASFVSRKDAQYRCDIPGGKKQFLSCDVDNGASEWCVGSIVCARKTILPWSRSLVREADVAIASFAISPPRFPTGTTTKYAAPTISHVVRLTMVFPTDRGKIDVSTTSTRKHGAKDCEGSWRTSKKILLRTRCNAQL